MLQNVANLGVGMILAFIYGWSLTLVVLAFIPFIVVGGFLQTFLLTGFANRVEFQRVVVEREHLLFSVFPRIKALWRMLERSVSTKGQIIQENRLSSRSLWK
jgi:ABC-type bacteriocin/lantibiotic exporter with double-glycine peptidase domain